MACHLVEPAFLSYEKELRAYLNKQLKDADLSHDLLNDVLLKVHRNCEQLEKVSNVRAWLYTITRNALRDHWRSAKRTQPISEKEQLSTETSEEALYPALEHLLPQLIGFLPEEYALPLRLSDLEGIPQQQIADQLGMSLSGAKSRIQRARRMLKEQFFECLDMELDARGVPLGFEVKPHCTPLQENALPTAGESGCNCKTEDKKGRK
jgi:RNA polymerase sigma-70 factor (ECF subfamily)